MCTLSVTSNQDDPDESNRSEDRLIAYTWKWVIDRLLVGEEPNMDIVLRCPMTKAAKRGLDAVAGVALQEVGLDINHFVVSGASKVLPPFFSSKNLLHL